jgi:helix-turn-helix, Psq domain
VALGGGMANKSAELLLLEDRARVQQAVDAVQSKAMSLRKAEEVFGVSRSKIQRRTSGQLPIDARNGKDPILTPGEELGVIEAIEQRTRHGQCFTPAQLTLFIRKCVEDHEKSLKISRVDPMCTSLYSVTSRKKGPATATKEAIASRVPCTHY